MSIEAWRGDLPIRVYVSMRVYHRGWKKAISCRGMTLRIEGYEPPEVFYRFLLGLGMDPYTAAAERTKATETWKGLLHGLPPTGPRGNPTGNAGSGVRIHRRIVRNPRGVARSKATGRGRK